ncbi:MAG: hypothetical protein HY720_20880 [Planctomycetes bacterium]|nr:hypothetical protein [Planctomycetota bacterium]
MIPRSAGAQPAIQLGAATPDFPGPAPDAGSGSAGAARARALALVEQVRRDPAGALPEVCRLAWTEPDDSLRRLGIRLLGRIDLAESRATLRDLIAAEDHPGIRDLARRVLETMETAPR